MGSWWRSEEMVYVSLIMSEHAAPAIIRELGVLGCMQFTDLNPELTPFQRRFVSYVKRCDEIERKIRYLHGETKALDIPIKPAGEVIDFIESPTGTDAASHGAYLLETLESKLDTFEQQLVELNKYSTKLTEEYNAKLEFHHVLIKARTVFLTEMGNIEQSEANAAAVQSRIAGMESGIQLSPLLSEISSASHDAERGQRRGEADELTFSNIAGVLPCIDRARFERMLFRATRGNCYVRFSDITPKIDENSEVSPEKTANTEKSVFIIFYKSQAIEGKIKKICDAFNCRRFDTVDLDRPSELIDKQEYNFRELKESKMVLDKNRQTREKICSEVSTQIESWLWTVRREKAIYHALNFCKSDIQNVLRIRAWVLKNQIGKAKGAIARAHASLNISSTAMFEKVPEQWPSYPTHFTTNKYTQAFQDFVDTYGIPRYREINPALFTAATFPFLFGVMYGDVGHGTCLALGGLYLVLTESKAESRDTGEMLKGVYVGRYMFLAMGLFAIYAGLIYNDYFSIGLNLFGSNYAFTSHEDGAKASFVNGGYGDSKYVYPFGIDPAWKVSENELLFFNSMKMKTSVILGIIQMIFGISLRGINSWHFRQTVDFFTEFLPMIIFAVGFFGYMVILIFVKWSINWDHRMAIGSCSYDQQGNMGACNLGTSNTCYSYAGTQCDKSTPLVDTIDSSGNTIKGLCPLGYGGTGGGCQPPNLITTLINIALQPGTVLEPLYPGQGAVQNFLLIVAFLCVPWLLLVKPYILKYQNDEKMKNAHHNDGAENPLFGGEEMGYNNPHGGIENSDSGGDGGSGGHGHGEEFNFAEIFIHQAIETIEFVLGMISNTASYLRLWALSLAHTELAAVFWEKAMVPAMNSGNPVFIVVGYAVFAAVTTGVLLCMDVLECFLHALRLHWVEFQNKFYKADGIKFQPFDFKTIISKAQLE